MRRVLGKPFVHPDQTGTGWVVTTQRGSLEARVWGWYPEWREAMDNAISLSTMLYTYGAIVG